VGAPLARYIDEDAETSVAIERGGAIDTHCVVGPQRKQLNKHNPTTDNKYAYSTTYIGSYGSANIKPHGSDEHCGPDER